jgi:ABC-type uncharacterized transport system involved in gliding motility auxiliary subunit
MRNILTIAQKELSIYFSTTIGYVGFGAYTFLMGLVFVSTLNRYQQMTQYYLGQQQPQLLEQLNFNDQIIQPMLSTGYWMFLFFVPFLTMRLFAEEKSQRTFELLMTAPITSLEIVLGKFLGVGLMMVVMSALPLVFPLILHVYGTSSGPGSAVEWMPVYSGLLMVFLLGLTFAAVGMFVSALTESQIVAAVLHLRRAACRPTSSPSSPARLDGDWRLVLDYAHAPLPREPRPGWAACTCPTSSTSAPWSACPPLASPIAWWSRTGGAERRARDPRRARAPSEGAAGPDKPLRGHRGPGGRGPGPHRGWSSGWCSTPSIPRTRSPWRQLNLAGGRARPGIVYAATNWRRAPARGRRRPLHRAHPARACWSWPSWPACWRPWPPSTGFAAQEPQEWDLTRDKPLSPSRSSRSHVAHAPRSRTSPSIGFFRSSESARQVLEESVNLYKLHTDKLELVFINPDAPPPELIQKLDLNNASPRIVFESETGQVAKVRNATEEDLTNALIKVAERPARKVYFLTGHGEPAIDDAQAEDGYAIAASQLRNEGLTVEALSLLDRENVPKDASVVVVAGAKSALFPNEVETLKVWLNRGGRLVALLEPDLDYGMESIWRPFGVLVGDDLVLEPNPTGRAKGFGYESPVITAYEPHPITNKLKSAASLLYRARSVQPKVGLANLEVVTLFQTSPTSWGEVSWREGGPPERSEGDVPGPVPLAVAVTKKTATVAGKVNDEARMVVVGDLHFANNRFLPMGAHRDLFVNMTSWVIGDEDRIAVRPKSRSGDRLPITETQQYGIMFFSVNLLPLLIVGFGFSVWAVRRRK